MSLYSEMMGSFIRTGNYPIEANYYFNTELELLNFYKDPINKTTLHKGLLRVVGDLDLYWVTSFDGELYFKKLLSKNSLDSINNILKDVEDVEELTKALSDNVKNVIDLIKNITGTNEDDIIEYLKTLPYNSITAISNRLDELFNDLNSLKETTSESLEEFESSLKELISTHKHDIHNLQTELDLTQSGIGLSGDGSFNADIDTYYLLNATSVMNALKILDRILKRVLDKEEALVESAYYDSENEDLVINFKTLEGIDEVRISAEKLIEEWDIDNEGHNVTLKRIRVKNGPDILSADVNISNDDNNIIVNKPDGIYAKADFSEVNLKIKDLESNKVDKVEGKGLSTNDYSTEDKGRLDAIYEGDKTLLTPSITSKWAIKSSHGTAVTLPGISLTSNTITVEKGYKVDYEGYFKWVHNDSYKDPISVSGDYGKTLPSNNVNSETTTYKNVTSTTTYTVTFSAPKRGLMVSGTKVLPATGNDTTSATAKVTFQDRRFYGVTSDSDITTLGTNNLTASKALTVNNVTTNTSLYYRYAYPKSLGALTAIILNGAQPIKDAFDLTEKTIINAAGISVVYYVYTSKNVGAFTNASIEFK